MIQYQLIYIILNVPDSTKKSLRTGNFSHASPPPPTPQHGQSLYQIEFQMYCKTNSGLIQIDGKILNNIVKYNLVQINTL